MEWFEGGRSMATNNGFRLTLVCLFLMITVALLGPLAVPAAKADTNNPYPDVMMTWPTGDLPRGMVQLSGTAVASYNYTVTGVYVKIDNGNYTPAYLNNGKWFYYWDNSQVPGIFHNVWLKVTDTFGKTTERWHGINLTQGEYWLYPNGQTTGDYTFANTQGVTTFFTDFYIKGMPGVNYLTYLVKWDPRYVSYVKADWAQNYYNNYSYSTPKYTNSVYVNQAGGKASFTTYCYSYNGCGEIPRGTNFIARLWFQVIQRDWTTIDTTITFGSYYDGYPATYYNRVYDYGPNYEYAAYYPTLNGFNLHIMPKNPSYMLTSAVVAVSQGQSTFSIDMKVDMRPSMNMMIFMISWDPKFVDYTSVAWKMTNGGNGTPYTYAYVDHVRGRGYFYTYCDPVYCGEFPSGSYALATLAFSVTPVWGMNQTTNSTSPLKFAPFYDGGNTNWYNYVADYTSTGATYYYPDKYNSWVIFT